MKNKHKVSDGIVYREFDSNLIILDQLSKKYHVLNETAKEILLLCNGKNTTEDIVSIFKDAYSEERAHDMESDIVSTINGLVKLGIIESENM